MSAPEDDGGPRRTCVGCRSRRPQSDLVRLHLAGQGGDRQGRLAVDRNGPGRGAWLCADSAGACLEMAVDRKALARAFRQIPDPDSVSALLEEWSDGA